MAIILAVFRFFLSLRYKVEIKGLDVLNKKGSYLILPNHQALVDPQILASQLWKKIQIVPVVTEGMYRVPLLHSVLKYMDAVSVSDLSAGSRDTDVLKNVTLKISDSLQSGHSVLLYPSGQISGQGYEKIFNKKSAHNLVLNLPPNTRIIGVRIRGLWGSMWSRAWIGKSPNLITTYLKAIGFIFANLLIFCPRRKIFIELEDITEYAKELAHKNRKSFNDGLEKFYNKYGEEQAVFVKHFFYAAPLKRELPAHIEGSVLDAQSKISDEKTAVSPELLNEVLLVLSEELSIDSKGITINSNFTMDLGIDSITMVAIITEIENHFKVVAPNVSTIKTMHDLCLVAMGQANVKITLKDSNFNLSKLPLEKIRVNGSKTIHELFVQTFTQHNNEPFVWDNMLGSTTRKDFYLKTMVIAQIIKKEVSGEYVGIMLPALQSTTLLVAATYMAGKIPVMLNWTVGPQVLQHCVNTANLSHIITAGTFFDRVRDKLSDDVKAKCIFFEKKVKEASLALKLRGLLNSKLKPTFNIQPNNIAVILFTSGSESLPKAVPLTHKNILRDMEGSFNHLDMGNDSVFVSFLPPFHSFGFTVLTIVPIVTAMKVAYTPDPTATRDIVDVLKHTQANTMLATPTFLKMILAISTKEDLQNVRLVVTGAESLQPAIIEDFKKKAAPGAEIIEGYGITECSPALTLNPPGKQKLKSVGTFISTVEHVIVDLQKGEPLEQGKEGMILVRGDNVFAGYIDTTVSSPFVTANGKEYYKTGDLGYVDSDGYLFITGRLKRFIKIAGEMISLPAIEQILLEKYGSNEEVVLAVEGSDALEVPQIVLFSIHSIDILEANQFLKSSGFSNLIKLHKVVNLQEIPLLGTGKTDYKVLKGMIG
jgi:long-chain-fatty-acid--[acyl-carrier-protein] ligase